jgi:LDH2 family malate/lactate/ureidoglycolate dehydrogenase
MYHRVEYERLLARTQEILERIGYPAHKAKITAWVLTEADARGVSSHGVTRIKVYRNEMEQGHVNVNAEPEIVHETPVSIVVDGHYGVGAHIAEFTMDRVLDKTREHGTCYASVRNSNHFGMAGLWAEMAVKEGFGGSAFTNTIRCAVPTLGCERLLGTNPIAFGLPSDEGLPFLLDMATTTAPRGKLGVYKRRGLPLPEGWFVDENGGSVTDPAEATSILADPTGTHGGLVFLGGATEIMSGHKGYGLALLVDMLCGPLAHGPWTRDVFQTQDANVGHFFSAFRLDLFGDERDVRRRVGDVLRALRASSPSEEGGRVYTHGEKETLRRAKALKDGVELDDATYSMLEGFASELGLGTLPATGCEKTDI